MGETAVPRGREQDSVHTRDSRTLLDSVRVQGFRSLRDVELTGFGGATVLIGANGSGKSNLIRFFEMLSWMLRSRSLQQFVVVHGGAGDQLFRGSRTTPMVTASIRLSNDRGTNDYSFTLAHGAEDRLHFADERWRFSSKERSGEAPWESGGSGHREAAIVEAAQGGVASANQRTARVICNMLRNCGTFQFHDTSRNAGMKKLWDVTDNARLRADGSNLAAVLYRLEHQDVRRYELICRHIARVLPIFERFDLVEQYGKVMLRWKGTESDMTFGPHLTSDGSLRFFALVTLLSLPTESLPSIILLDEPELGLHPSAVSLLGSMIQSVAVQHQVIVATQSPLLVDAFELDDVTVLELEDGETQIRRLSNGDYERWLEDGFTTGELWQTNLLGGRP